MQAYHIPTILSASTDSDGCGSIAGRGCHTKYGWAGLCVSRVARLSGSHRWLSGSSAFLGWLQGKEFVFILFFNIHNLYSNLVFVERLGIHLKVDKLLFDSVDRCRFLSSLLQLCVHKLVAAVTLENRSAVVELRGHTHESARVSCNAKATDQGDPAQGLQGSWEWQVCKQYLASTFK